MRRGLTRSASRRVFRNRREAGRVLAGSARRIPRTENDAVVLGLASRRDTRSPGKWPRRWGPRWMPSSYANSALPAMKSSRWGHWPAVARVVVNDDMVRALRIDAAAAARCRRT